MVNEEQLKEAQEKSDIDAYNAETNRMKVMQDANAIDPQQLAIMAAQLVMQSLQNPLHEDEQQEPMQQHQMPDGQMMQDDEMMPQFEQDDTQLSDDGQMIDEQRAMMMGGGDMPQDPMGDLINPSDEMQGY